MANFPQLARFDDVVAGFDQVRGGAAFQSHLDHALMFPGGGQHGLPFEHIHTDGLLHVHIRAALDGGDHGQRVPMVGRATSTTSRSFSASISPVIVIRARFLFRLLARGHQIRRLRQHIAVHVAQRNDLHGRDLDEPEQIALAIPPAADQADALGFAGRPAAKGPAAHRARPGGGRHFEKFSPIHHSILNAGNSAVKT
jgi:hypothetical protein